MSRSVRRAVLWGIAALMLLMPVGASAAPGSFSKLGHEPLMKRGMNAALAVHGNYAYVGSRTDGGHEGMPHGGIMVVDISNPHELNLLGKPLYQRAGESTRELRVWRSQDILIVLNTNCGFGDMLHHCTLPSISNIRFYDISGANASHPQEISQFNVDTHEFYLWEDPTNPERALIFASNASPTKGCTIRGGSPSCQLAVWDISPVGNGLAPVTLYAGPHPYSTGGLHSLSVSNDGTRAYFALLAGGFAVADTSQFTAGTPNPQAVPVTPDAARTQAATRPGAHSALKLWNRNWAWVSDEVYGTATAPGHGCPWGWAEMVDISDPTAPTVEADYRLPENDSNDGEDCTEFNPPRTSYSAHNPTLTPHIGFSTWHSGGLQAVSLEQPVSPTKLAEYFPKPLTKVMLEDPRLSSDPDTGRHEKVVMWSYPVIKDGLIYVTDIRNGLYALRYEGPFEDEVNRIGFLEGNSNQGDALCYDPVGAAPAYCGN